MPIYHPDPPRFAVELEGERAVLRALSALPSDAHVFCNLSILDPAANRDREIDFLVLHRELGILIVEVKGGRLGWEGNVWSRIYRGQTQAMKEAPGAQLLAQEYALRRFLKDQCDFIPETTRILALPHMDLPEGAQFGSDLPTCRVLDQTKLKGLTPALRLAVSGGEVWETFLANRRSRQCEIRESSIAAIVAELTPTLLPPISLEEILDGEGRVLDEAARPILQHLASNFGKGHFHVLGAPGSGKSLIARMVAKDLASQGKKVLVLAFNRALTYAMQTEMHGLDGVDVATFHDFLIVQLNDLGLNPVPTGNLHQFFNTTLPELFLEHLDRIENRWDAIIIDEAQDLAAEWLPPVLRLLRNPEDPFLLLEDPSQNLYNRGRHNLGTTWRLDLNLRQNPSLRRAVWNAMPDCGWERPEVPIDPGIVKSRKSSPDTWKRDLEAELTLLANEGMDPSRILVLLPHRPDRFGLKDGQMMGPWRLNMEKDWWEADHAGRVRLNTVHAFKGLEADVVIYVAPQVKAEDLPSLRYTALSRARHRVVILEKALPAVLRTEEAKPATPPTPAPPPVRFNPGALMAPQRTAILGALKAANEWGSHPKEEIVGEKATN